MITIFSLAMPVLGQSPTPPPSERLPISIDSGERGIDGGLAGEADPHEASVVFSEIVSVGDAPWLQLSLGGTTLAERSPTNHGAFLRLTAMKDGAVQFLDATSLAQWNDRSAFFNGSDVLVELFVYPNSGTSRVRIDEVKAGLAAEGGLAAICGSTDERELSNDPRDARTSNGCTAFLIGEACMLTAGHCSVASSVEFNVPLSTPGGSWIFAHPNDQYAIDSQSKLVLNQNCSNEGMYFGVFPNSNTGLTPRQAQGEGYVLASSAPSSAGSPTVRIRGYGTTTSTNLPNSWNSVQKEHTGPLTQSFGTTIRYVVDTTGGNSGSAVIRESTGDVIGIHTCGGCGPSFGSNVGTAIQHPTLQDFLANPAGVCVDDLPPVPANNTCSDSIFVSGGSTSIDNSDATTSEGQESVTCGGTAVQSDVWYSHTAGCTGTMTISVCDADFDVNISAFLGSCPNTEEQVVTCSSSGCENGSGAAISFDISQGQFFRIRIGSDNSSQGVGTMTIECTPIDEPACPADLTGDGEVNVFDLLQLLSAWGSCPDCNEDLTGTGEVNVFDLLDLLAEWGPCS